MAKKDEISAGITDAVVQLISSFLFFFYGLPAIAAILPGEVILAIFFLSIIAFTAYLIYSLRQIIVLLSIPVLGSILYIFITVEVIESKIIYSLKENNNRIVVEDLFKNLEQTPLSLTSDNCGFDCSNIYNTINSMLDDGDLKIVGERPEKIQLNQEVLLTEKELVDFKNLIIIWNETIWPAFLITLAYVLLVVLAIFLLISLLIWHFKRTIDKGGFIRMILRTLIMSPNAENRPNLIIWIKQLAKRKIKYETTYKKDIKEGSKKSFEKLNHLEINDIKDQLKQQGFKESFENIFEEEYTNIKNKS